MKESLFKRFDVSVILISMLLFVIGTVAIQSSEAMTLWPPGENALKHVVFYVIGFFVMLFFASADYDAIGRLAHPIAYVNIIILLLVLVVGETAKGAQRWISLGLFSFQPSEPAKLIVIVALAKILSSIEKLDKPTVFSIVLTVFVPWALILIQPDLGTSLVIVFAAYVMLFFAGVNPWILLSTAVAGAAVGSRFLHDYQKDRLFVFLNPDADVSGIAWNITQSKIAVGSGGLYGKGIFQGTQTQLDFVPEHGTDFIFSVIGEEAGFIGCMAVLLLYLVLMLRCIAIVRSAKDKFGFFTAVGIFCLIGFHVFINIGMVLGIMPVVGLPLTFISYGGTALVSNMAALGILESIYCRRERLFIK